MPHSDFIHLHLHTQYSLLDGACRLPDLINLAKQYKMDSLAITDHGNMFGAVDFYMEAQKNGIKPIIGSEVYVAPRSRLERGTGGIEDAAYHMILLVKDELGYRNLSKLLTLANVEGFYYRPRIDKEILAIYHEGLIGMTACLKGEVPNLLLQNRFNDALKAADEYRNIMGKDNLYLELQENGIPEQKTVNEGLIRISKELKLPLVATNDVHYLKKENSEAHEALLCIQTQTTLDDPKRMRFQTNEFYFKSPEEMKAAFSYAPEAVTNTLEIAERCNLEMEFHKIHLPKYEPPVGMTKEDFLDQLCADGLKRKFPEADQSIKDRLSHELKVIKDMGFTSYFLIVSDFIHYARKNLIPVGPGRGSAAGSLVSYLLGITSIDPLKYKLLFERFLNPERVSMPDIDIDFCYERRQEVINYVTNKYGQENVAQIITFGTMQARAVVRDVGRVMAISYADVDRIAKMIPPDPGIALKDALESEPELKNLYKNDPQITKLMNIALTLEGLNRHASIHAAGVVIADKPLSDYMPMFKTGDDQITTGYGMTILEKIGLLKVDFLGLRTLTVIDQAIKIVKMTQGAQIDIENLPLDDPNTYKLLKNAQTVGVFQVESSGMRDLLRKMEPEQFEDLIALLALYRPGPMGSGMLSDFIQRRKTKSKIRYDHKKMEPILKDTYGIMVYQEQIMQIASALAGFSLAQADLLRRAMSKKNPDVMEQQRKAFVAGCAKEGLSEQVSSKIFDQIDYFSGYGFNRSHSAAYALISFRTAYLKANYPVEFMCALLTSERDNTDKIVEYVNESEHMGIEILPPDINASDALFTVVDPKKIRFGLLAVKNLGRGAIESIIQNRKANGAYSSLQDLCSRVDLRLVNRKVLESMIKCGAFDSFGLSRAAMFISLDTVLERASSAAKDKARGQMSFFDNILEQNSFKEKPADTANVKEWPEPQLLAFEKEMLGFYITGHPLTRYAKQLKRFASSPINDLTQYKDQDTVKIVGLITKVKQTLTRAKQEKMAILKLEDLDGIIEVLVFPQTFQRVARYVQANLVVMLQGKLNLKEETPKIIASDLYPVDEFYKMITAIDISLVSGTRENLFDSLKQILSSSPGKIPIYLHLESPAKSRVRLVVGDDLFVAPSEKLVQDIEDLLGQDKVSLRI